MEPPAEENVIPLAEAAVTEETLGEVFSAIIQAEKEARDLESAKKSIQTIQVAMSKLSPEGFNLLASNPEFQQMFERMNVTAGTKPGDPIYASDGRQIGYVPFSYDDFCRIYPMHTWLVPRNDVIEVNGVGCRLVEGYTMTAPKIFFDVQMESIRVEREASANQRKILQEMAPADGIDHAVGWYKATDEELIRTQGIER